jgi:hypothetical protein
MKLFKDMKRKMLLCGAVGAGTITSVSVALAEDESANQIIVRILGVVCSIFRYIGIVLLAWSIGMLVLSFKNEDADSKSRAVLLMVVSIALIAIKSLLAAILPAVGINNVESLQGF